MFSFVVAGAGLTGAVVARLIAEELGQNVLVVEKRTHIGGNCYDEIDEAGILVHRYGPHIFHTDSRTVFQFLSRFTRWREYRHRVLGVIDGKKVPVPFNLNSLHALFPQGLASMMEGELLKEYEYGATVHIGRLLAHGNQHIASLGKYIYEKIFLNYSKKQWGSAFKALDDGVLARVPVKVSRDDSYFEDRYQAIPVHGYTTVIRNILDHRNIRLLLNTPVAEIMDVDPENKTMTLFGRPYSGVLVYTGSPDELFQRRFGPLPYRAIRFEFESLYRTSRFQETATVNYPNNYDFTRITEFRHLHPSFSPHTTILREYPVDFTDSSPELVPGYPLPTDEARKRHNQYAGLARSVSSLFLAGRLGNYRYYDMDDAIEAAMRCFEEIRRHVVASSS